jgi:hypothetical protein
VKEAAGMAFETGELATISDEAEVLYEAHRAAAVRWQEARTNLLETVDRVIAAQKEMILLQDTLEEVAEAARENPGLERLRHEVGGLVGDVLLGPIVDVTLAEKAYEDNLAAGRTHFEENGAAYWQLAFVMEITYRVNKTLGEGKGL